MGLIGSILGARDAARQIGEAVGGVAQVFVGNRVERDEAAAQAYLAAVGELSAEFARAPAGRFDGFVDGLNRLPRPMLALGTLGLFVYSMVEPAGFATRMQGLQLVPEPLWWLLGAIVSFYFGARELHHRRTRALGGLAATRAPLPPASAPPASACGDGPAAPAVPAVAVRPADPDFNAAVEEWRALRG